MSKRWIGVSRIEGKASRQAHCDLPEGTYEREMGKEGFFGPACHMYHANPPTAWSRFEGPLRPRAFDTNKFAEHGNSPWHARELMHNAHCRLRAWRCSSSMDHLVRNADGDELIFVHNGSGHLFCDYGHMAIEAGDYIVLPRSTSWRLEVTSPLDLMLIEATNSSYMLPDKGLVGPHAIFDQAMLDAPQIDPLFKRQVQGE